MDFGIPTLIENKNIEENVALCKELNLKFIELNMNLPEYQIEELEKVSYLNDIANKAGIYFTIHLDENLNIADFNKSVANAYLETVIRTINVAKKMKAPIINMHMNHGVHFTLPDRKVLLFEQYYDEYRESFLKFKKVCESEIGESDIKLCIENTNGFRDYEKSVIRELLQSKVFGLTFDIGHSNAMKNIDDPFIMENKCRLKHFHIHDSLDKKDHMSLGTGEIDLEQRLNLAKEHKCRCVVETKTIDALRKSVVWLKSKQYIL